MTTKYSPLHMLKAQADSIADTLRKAERGRYPSVQFKKKVEEARAKPSIVVGIVMDDKTIKLDIPWKNIRETTKESLSEYILGLMQETRKH